MDPRDALELIAESVAVRRDDAAAVNDGQTELAPAGLVHVTRLPAQDAHIVPLPEDLPDLVKHRLELLGITGLWTHQAETFARAQRGQHTIVATGTASGKSLAYQLPVLDAILRDDSTFSLYLAPTKALAHDQLRAFRAFRLPQVRAAAIDGDTPGPERDAIRRTANVVLTNPDLLHHSLLGDHRRWATLLHRLRYIIVDEAHTARGVFGSHVALVLRRLARLAASYGANPTWLLASATIGNPAEHASRLTGAQVAAVSADGAPRGPRHIGLWQPPVDEDDHRRSALTDAAHLLAAFVASEIRTIVFTRSRKAAEVVAISAQQRVADLTAQSSVPLAERIAAYRAGYLADDRRELERQLRSGELLGVAATDALELGIDVSGLDAVILAGWPGTAASFWQRIGRAGRGLDASVGVLVASDDPLDQWFADHPRDLVERPAEDAIIDPSNPHLLAPHLRCACQELALAPDEAAEVFDDSAVALLAADVEEGTLRKRAGKFHWVGRERAAAAFTLRSATMRQVRIVDTDTGAVIGDVDEPRAHQQVHTGAVYLHQGRHYRVRELDLTHGHALVEQPPSLPLRTRARHDTDVAIIETAATTRLDGVVVHRGNVQVTTHVTSYDVLSANDEVVERVALDLPPVVLDTAACWYTLPEDICARLGIRPPTLPGALHAAEHAAIGMLGLIALCDRWDLGGLSTTQHPDTGLPTVFIYDAYPGGAGLTERAFTRFGEHHNITRQRVGNCACRDGCPSCVQSPKCGNGNTPLDKAGALTVLTHLATAAHP